MPKDYDISGLKKQLETMTGKKVHLYDEEELPYDVDIENDKLEGFARKAFKELFGHLAVKNLFKQQVKAYIKDLSYVKNQRQLDDLMRSVDKKLEDQWNRFTVEKDLIIGK